MVRRWKAQATIFPNFQQITQALRWFKLLIFGLGTRSEELGLETRSTRKNGAWLAEEEGDDYPIGERESVSKPPSSHSSEENISV